MSFDLTFDVEAFRGQPVPGSVSLYENNADAWQGGWVTSGSVWDVGIGLDPVSDPCGHIRTVLCGGLVPMTFSAADLHLQVAVNGVTGASDITFSLYPLTGVADVLAATWHSRMNGRLWSAEGGDFNSGALIDSVYGADWQPNDVLHFDLWNYADAHCGEPLYLMLVGEASGDFWVPLYPTGGLNAYPFNWQGGPV